MARRPYTGRTTSPFGPRLAPIKGASTFHQGVDGVGGYNTAPEAGKVTAYSYVGGWGNLISFEGDSGTLHTLAHNAPGGLLVPVGSRHPEGTPLGIKGMTGTATGVHVHWETRPRGGIPIDPEVWLRNQGGTAGGDSIPIITSIKGVTMYLLFDTNGVGMLVTENGTTGIETPEHYNLLARVIRSNQANAQPERMWPAEIATVDSYLRRAAGKPTATIDEAALARALDAVIDDEAILAAVKAIVPGGSGAPVDLTKVLEAIAANTAAIAATPDAVRKALKDAL